MIARCSRCRALHARRGQRYCRACHAAYMRAHRPKHRDLGSEARMRANARSYANVYQSRGRIQRCPCDVTGCRARAEKHHEDYRRPLSVRWLCRAHHLALHAT